MKTQKRRGFLKQGLLLTGLAGFHSAPLKALTESGHDNYSKEVLSFGLLTDLHHDLIRDGTSRVDAFIEEMNRVKPDFIMQMGDFCTPKPANKTLMAAWERFEGAKYHVIGNHDVDGGFNHHQVVDFWKSQGIYYSFNLKGYHFIVLNGNELSENEKSEGYPRSISRNQYNWLKDDLEGTNLPVLIFCHQGIDNDLDGIREGAILRLLFEKTNKKAGFSKVKAVFSGHNHEDYHNLYNGINYIQINSASYQFGRKGKDYEFAHSIDPLWALVTIYTNGTIRIKGKSSMYRDGKEYNSSDYNGYPTVPLISDRIIK